MKEVTVYEVEADFDGVYWTTRVINMPSGKAAMTQGRSWLQAHDMTVSLLSKVLEISEDSISIIMRPVDEEMASATASVIDARKHLEEAKTRYAQALSGSARALTRRLPVRDVGAMLKVSHQLISKLAPRDPARASTAHIVNAKPRD